MKQERYEQLMVAVADGHATEAEKELLMSYVQDKPELAKELDAHIQLKSITDGWMERIKLDLVEDRENQEKDRERSIGITLVLIGIAILCGFGCVEMLLDSQVPLYVRIGIGAVSSGILLLFLSLIRQRIQTSKSDKYTEIIR